MEELIKLEEKINRLVSLIIELKQKVEDLEEHNSRLNIREQEIKKRVDGLVEKVDNLLI